MAGESQVEGKGIGAWAQLHDAARQILGSYSSPALEQAVDSFYRYGGSSYDYEAALIRLRTDLSQAQDETAKDALKERFVQMFIHN